ncbi:MAG: hypothetical protein E5V54_24040 [Mesorhizobium sp.]|nr:MAG: hypothetical protein E5V54_24040 [Mesorhizobium sp.]
MSSIIVDFPPRRDPIQAYGRFGYFEAKQVSVIALSDHLVIENRSSEASVVLPADRNTIRDVANYLHRIADKLP